jgi:hypothetical protein
MIEFRVSTNGLEINEVVQKLSAAVKEKLIERLTDVVFEAVFWGVPVKSGYLSSTVYKEVGFGEGKVGVAASYAEAVEKGTVPHEIHPINGRVLAFAVAGKMVFRSVVNHPGTKANPFMERGVDLALTKVDSVFSGLWLEVVGG